MPTSDLPTRRPTIADVAARAGVSNGAVSFALNGAAGVSKRTRERILAAAEELGWRPSAAAQALSQSRAGTVGLVLSRPMRTLGTEPFFNQFSSGLSARLAESDLGLQTFIVANADDELATYRRWWLERRVDGFVLLDPVADDHRIAFLAEAEAPGVLVGPPEDSDPLSVVWSDDVEAMQRCIDHLVDLGHRRVAHVGGIPGFRHVDRRAATLAATLRAGRLDAAMTYPADFSEDSAARVTAELLSLADPPSAVIYDSDLMALAGLGVALQSGIRIPEQLSIVSFDDSPLTRLSHPSITALTRDTFELGEAAATVLAGVLDGGAPQRLQMPTPTLAVRASTAARPRRNGRGRSQDDRPC